jgi:hypothetical protein
MMPRLNEEPLMIGISRKFFYSLKGLVFISFFVAGLTGCVSVKLPPPSASTETVLILRSANLSSTAVGDFKLAEGKDPAMDKRVGGLRGSSLVAESGSFSQQLKDEIVVALRAAGVYDDKAPIRIEGRLTDSMVDAAIKTGTGRLAARFIVDRNGKRVYDKELVVESSWSSSFIGAVAIPRAVNEYGALYKKLTNKLFSDKEFLRVLKP